MRMMIYGTLIGGLMWAVGLFGAQLVLGQEPQVEESVHCVDTATGYEFSLPIDGGLVRTKRIRNRLSRGYIIHETTDGREDRIYVSSSSWCVWSGPAG